MILGHHLNRPIKQIIFFTFSDDFDYILVGLLRGFAVYRISSIGTQLVLKRDDFKQEMASVAVSCIDIQKKTNIFALVMGGVGPLYEGKRVVVWDELNEQIIFEIGYDATVRSARIMSRRLVVMLLTKIIVYDIDNRVEKLFEFDMYWNENAVLGISKDSEEARLIAFPSHHKGQIQCVELYGGWTRGTEIFSFPFTSILAGHNSSIAAIEVSDDGRLVASASKNGTLIRIWNSRSGSMNHEFRRGVDYCEVYSLAFNILNSQIAVISEKQTLHIFNLNTDEKHNRVSSLSKVPYLPKYFASDWSFSSVHVPCLDRCIIKFDKNMNAAADNSNLSIIYILNADGGFYVYEIDDSKEGNLTASAYHRFID